MYLKLDMKDEELRTLIDKHLAGTASSAERLQLQEFEDQFSESAEGLVLEDQKKFDLKQRIYNQIQLTKGSIKLRIVNQFGMLMAAAAIITLIIFSISITSNDGSFEHFLSESEQVIARTGEVREVTLSDGSVVTLNANSSLRFKKTFNGNTRDVTLEGEAFFQVTPDKQKPFLIHSGQLRTKVVGTSFNIAAYRKLKDIKVTVATGSVQVNQGNRLVALLSPGTQVIFNKQSNKSQYKKVNQADYTSWRNGELIFKQATFQEIAVTLKQVYDYDLIVVNPRLNSSRITSRFHKSMPIRSVLNILTAVSCSNYTIQGKQIFIKGKGCLQENKKPIESHLRRTAMR
jgi:transmembrane sensor